MSSMCMEMGVDSRRALMHHHHAT